MAFNFDGRSAADITIGAVGADRWEVDIQGKASHAGVYPDRGISATMIAALAMAEAYSGGWFGKVVKNGREGTSNVGPFGGADGKAAGDATNVVTDYVHIKGESRSHDSKFFHEITKAYKAAFTEAACLVTDHEGKTGKVKFVSRTDYHPFRLKDDAPVVKRAIEAVKSIGREPSTKVTNGGLDANWMVKHGIPTVTFGRQNDIHTGERVGGRRSFEGKLAWSWQRCAKNVGGRSRSSSALRREGSEASFITAPTIRKSSEARRDVLVVLGWE